MRSSTASDDWEEGLVAGNGRQGALSYGRPGTLRIGLCHERLFLPVEPALPAPQTARILPQLRAALLRGAGRTAAEQVVTLARTADPGYAQLRRIDPLIGAGTLSVTGLPADGYERGVEYATGVVWQRHGGVRCELFVSRADDVVVLRLRADPQCPSDHPVCPAPLRLRLAALPGEPPVPIRFAADAAPGQLRLSGRFTTGGYVVAVRVLADGVPAGEPDPRGGAAEPPELALDSRLVTSAGRELLVLLRTLVDRGAGLEDPTAPLAGLPADWDRLLAAHERLHRPLVEACALRLSGPSRTAETGRTRPARTAAEEPTSEELLAAPGSAALVQELFAAGRYAIISSTGELPPTLQGVWSGTYRPAWEGGYTLDGNLFTALSGLAPTGTPELLLPLFDLLDSRRDDFVENARRLYGARGVLLPPHMSSHGKHNHFDAQWCLTFWTAGGAWASRLYAEYAEHTGDVEFWQQRALSFLRLVRDFERDFAPDATFVPSYSPENTPAGTDSQAGVNATLDVAASRALRTDLGENAGNPAPGERVDRLPRYTVAADGTLDEWLWPGLAPNHAHRHASHLFPVWYPDPALFADPALVAAARATVRARLAWWRENGNEMAFGLTGLGLAAAQLGMADECEEILTLLSGYWRPSLVSTHNRGEIFNVDICGGLPAMVVRMLLRPGPVPPADACPRDGPDGSPGNRPARRRLDLLAALPAAWTFGELRGARAGLVRVPRLAWSPERIEVSLCARVETVLDLGVPAGYPKQQPLELAAGKVVDVCLVNRKTNSHALPPTTGTP